MNKLTMAIFALLLAVLGGCASGPGGVFGIGTTDTYKDSGPFPRGVVMQADG